MLAPLPSTPSPPFFKSFIRQKRHGFSFPKLQCLSSVVKHAFVWQSKLLFPVCCSWYRYGFENPSKRESARAGESTALVLAALRELSALIYLTYSRGWEQTDCTSHLSFCPHAAQQATDHRLIQVWPERVWLASGKHLRVRAVNETVAACLDLDLWTHE